MIKNFNKDIMDWDSFPEHDMVWTDPPWGQRMVKTFETMMRKQTGKVVENSIEGILSKLAKLSSTSKPLVIEYDEKGYEYMIEVMKSHGHRLISVNTRKQTAKRNHKIVVFNYPVEISESAGFKMVRESIENTPAQVIFDPFAGIGQTAKAVKKAGKIYIGSELNPSRYEKLCKINS